MLRLRREAETGSALHISQRGRIRLMPFSMDEMFVVACVVIAYSLAFAGLVREFFRKADCDVP